MKTQTFEILPVSPEEWAICRELALELAENDSASTRNKLRRYLYSLLKKYPGNVDVMASLADIYVHNRSAIKLLQKAYETAQKNNDFKNMTFISDSLASRYLAIQDFSQAYYWYDLLAENLKNYHDQEIYDHLTLTRELLNITAGTIYEKANL